MNIIQDYITENKYFQRKQIIDVKKLILHSVGCNQPNASVFAKQYHNKVTNYVPQGMVQADGTVYQFAPWNYFMAHVGDANSYSIGIEMTEPSQIKYTQASNFTCSNITEAQKQVKGTYETAVELFAYLCELYNLNPLTDIMSHNEAYKAGIGTNHTDPEHLWKGLNMSYTMDGFRQDVQKEMDRKENTIEMTITKEELIALIDERIDKAQENIATIDDVPNALKKEVRELLDCEAINGGTSYAVNPNDINLPYDILRGIVISKRYTDKK